MWKLAHWLNSPRGHAGRSANPLPQALFRRSHWLLEFYTRLLRPPPCRIKEGLGVGGRSCEAAERSSR